jgi:uncharacterized protein
MPALRPRRASPNRRIALLLTVCLAIGGGGAVQAQVAFGDGVTVPVASLREVPFKTVVRQKYDYSCGSAALATLLSHHYGRPISEASVFKAMYAAGDKQTIQKLGFSLFDMQTYLKTLGLQSDGYKTSLDKLAEAGVPAIAVLHQGSYSHFVVIKGVQGDRVLVGDPARGLKTYPRAEFASMWDGVLFVIKGPEGEFNRADEWDWHVRGAGWQRSGIGAESLSALQRELPPLYQLTPAIDGMTGLTLGSPIN